MDEALRGGVFGVLSVLIGMTILTTAGMASRNKPPKKDGSHFILKYSRGYLFFCGLFSVVCIGGCIGGFINAPRETLTDRIGFPIAFVFLGAGVFYLVKDALLVSFRFDERGVEKFSPWTSETMAWREIDEVTYNGNWHSFVLKGAGKRIRVLKYVAGLRTFLEYLDRNASSESLHAVRQDMDSLLSD